MVLVMCRLLAGDLYKWSLKLFGTSANPLASNVVRASTIKADSNSVSTTSGKRTLARISLEISTIDMYAIRGQ